MGFSSSEHDFVVGCFGFLFYGGLGGKKEINRGSNSYFDPAILEYLNPSSCVICHIKLQSSARHIPIPARSVAC